MSGSGGDGGSGFSGKKEEEELSVSVEEGGDSDALRALDSLTLSWTTKKATKRR